MITPTIDLIHAHGSIRHYKPDPVPVEVIETIISAAQRSSTSSNLQAYSVIVVTDADKRQKLSKLCDNQKHITEAPVFLAWCADLARLNLTCQLRGYTQVTDQVENFLVAAVDTAIAAQTGALAAESLGLGICYIGAIRNDPQAIIELLGLPKLVFPVCGMTIGWPIKAPRRRPRLPLSAVLHWERYNSVNQEDALLQYDREMAASGIYRKRQVPTPVNEEEVEDYGWLEHTARRVSKVTRAGLRADLEKQGFGVK